MTSETEQWIREEIANRGMTLEQFATSIDVAPITLRSWLTSRNTPRISNIVRLAKGLGIPIPQLRAKIFNREANVAA